MHVCRDQLRRAVRPFPFPATALIAEYVFVMAAMVLHIGGMPIARLCRALGVAVKNLDD
jgi:hypothetical protein